MRHVNSAQALAAAQVLGLTEYDLVAVNKAYRTASKACHPDGGNYDPTRWTAIGQAKDTLTAYLEQNPEPVRVVTDACRACTGTGRVKRGSLQMHCVMCNGSGEAR